MSGQGVMHWRYLTCPRDGHYHLTAHMTAWALVMGEDVQVVAASEERSNAIMAESLALLAVLYPPPAHPTAL